MIAIPITMTLAAVFGGAVFLFWLLDPDRKK